MEKIPKRRKKKDNIYQLSINKEYQISFKNHHNERKVITISKEIYDVFNEYELKDIKELNEYDRHIEHLEQTDEFLFHRMQDKKVNIEEEVILKIRNEHLYQAILSLPSIQRRRVIMYYFKGMTLKEISKIERCSIRAIKYSIDIALVKLKEKLKNF